jgi:hypothetical protein
MTPNKHHAATTLSRRNFGKLLGMQTALATTVALTAGTTSSAAEGDGGRAISANPAAALNRAGFVALISDYFNWVHSSEYVDPYKAVQPTFADVTLGTTPHARQIETALEAGIISNAEGYFYPDRPVTRQDAANILARAFAVPLAGVVSMFAKLHSTGVAAGRSALKINLSDTEAQASLKTIAASQVAPPQVMCKSGTTAPRRYVRLSTPTKGATIYYTLTLDGSEPADPTTSAGQIYDFTTDGVLQLVNPLSSTTDSRLYRIKAVATRPGLASSSVQEFTWNIVRPQTGAFQAKLVHAGNSTTPRVWKIHNPAEYFQANVYYIEGSQRGLVFDSGEYSYQKANIKTFIDTLATKPYDIVLGHIHPDHAEQIFNFTSAGVALHVSGIERAALIASTRPDFQEAGKASRVLEDGEVLDLGNVQITAFQIPGHTNGLTTIIVNQTGWVYGSDMWGCNRAYTADTTQFQAVKVDLFLSLVQQLIVNYQQRSASGQITELTNAHQEVPVGMIGINNFVKCLQQLIDEGNSVARPSIRGGSKGGDRMSMVGDMWRDRNWMAVGPIGKYAAAVDYLSKPTSTYPCGASVDYNAADGFRKYSVLSNVEFSGGTLVGVDIYWAPPTSGTPNRQSNKFDPWTYDYKVKVAADAGTLAIKPTAMSNQVRSMKVNGATLKQGSAATVAATPGSTISVDIVAPDGSSTSEYRFSVVTA